MKKLRHTSKFAHNNAAQQWETRAKLIAAILHAHTA